MTKFFVFFNYILVFAWQNFEIKLRQRHLQRALSTGFIQQLKQQTQGLSRTVIMIFQALKSMACNTSFIIKINATSPMTTDAPASYSVSSSYAKQSYRQNNS